MGQDRTKPGQDGTYWDKNRTKWITLDKVGHCRIKWDKIGQNQDKMGQIGTKTGQNGIKRDKIGQDRT